MGASSGRTEDRVRSLGTLEIDIERPRVYAGIYFLLGTVQSYLTVEKSGGERKRCGLAGWVG